MTIPRVFRSRRRSLVAPGLDAERGQILVLFVLVLVAILWMTRLLIDGASAMALRRAMQDSSDAAALAGANVLIGTNCEAALSAVRTSAHASLAANNWGSDRATAEITCAPGWDNMGVTVRLSANSSGMFFTPMPLVVDSTAINGERFRAVTSVLTLHRDRCNAFYLNGTVNLTFAGGLHVNSSAASGVSPCNNSQAAAVGKGGASVVNLKGESRMRVRGGHLNINVQPPPEPGELLADPYAAYDEPATRPDIFPQPLNPAIDREVERQCTQVPYQSPIYGPIDSDGNGTIQASVDYNGNGVIESLDYDGDGVYGERVEGIDWVAGARPNTGGFPNDAYLNSLTVINGDIEPVDGVVDFYENEWNDDLDHNGQIDQGIIGYETLYRTVCRDLYAWIMSPGKYTSAISAPGVTPGTVPSPSSGNYLVFLPGAYVFQNLTVRNGGGVLCTLPEDDPNRPGAAGWTYQSVKSYCDSVTTWTSVCPSLSDQRDGAIRCGALLNWNGFTTCGNKNPPEILSAGGNGETLLRQYLSGAAEGEELERYDGFLLWFSRTHAGEPGCNASLRGGGASQFSGTIYGPTTNLNMSGGGSGEAGSLTLQMVVQTIEFKGGSIFDFEYDEAELVRYAVYGLVE